MMFTLLTQGWFIVVFAACIAAIFLLALTKLRAKEVGGVAGLRRKPSMLNEPEKKLFSNLCDALDHDFHIFAKVGVLDVLERGARLSKRRYQKMRKQLESERFDYVVCRKGDMSVAAVIELECFEKNVSSARKLQRNTLVTELCKATKLKLFFFDPRQDYLGVDLRRLIAGSSGCTQTLFKKAAKTDKQSSSWSNDLTGEPMKTEFIGDNLCPDCNSELVTRILVASALH